MAPFRGLPHTTGSAGGSDWVCLHNQPRRRQGPLAGPDAGNWLCFVGALPASDALQVLVGTALVLEMALAQIGFVWRRSPVRSDAARRSVAWASRP